jgi:hypothetical protein
MSTSPTLPTSPPPSPRTSFDEQDVKVDSVASTPLPPRPTTLPHLDSVIQHSISKIVDVVDQKQLVDMKHVDLLHIGSRLYDEVLNQPVHAVLTEVDRLHIVQNVLILLYTQFNGSPSADMQEYIKDISQFIDQRLCVVGECIINKTKDCCVKRCGCIIRLFGCLFSQQQAQ